MCSRSKLRTSVPCVVEDLGVRKLFAAVVLAGTSGADTFDLAIVGSAVHVDFNGVGTNYYGVSSISVSGGGGADKIDVDSSITMGCVLSGNSGDDTISGGAGPDQITGNDGNDYITGNYGRDTLSGNNNNDTMDGGAQSDVLYGGTGQDELYAGSGGNMLYQNDAGNNLDSCQDFLSGSFANQANDTYVLQNVAPDWDYIFYQYP